MKIKLLSEGAKVPVRTTEGAAGYDLYLPKDYVVNPGRNRLPLDIAIQLDHHTEAQIRPRSGFSLNGIEGFALLDTTTPLRFDADVLLGTLDEDFQGNVSAIIKSYEKTPFIIKKGTRVAQLVISKYVANPFEIVENLEPTKRGENGFGHTGTK